MNTCVKKIALAAMMMVIPLSPAGIASAQMDNRPYSFDNAASGVGMSPGGKQAIINQKIFDETPDNLLRGPDGFLLDVIKGPGSVVIVRREDNGAVIPGYRPDFREGAQGMQVGTFNLYFNPAYSYRAYSTYDDYQTANIIGAWISAVAPGLPFYPASPVSSWTVFVYGMD